MSTRQAGPSRLPGLLVVVVALVLAGVANATMRARPAVRPAPDRPSEPSMVLASSNASSSAWYCAGPLPVGAGHEASSIAVANVGPRPVRGELVVASSAGSQKTTPIVVGAHAQAVYGLTRQGGRSVAAATVLVNSASVGVEELVHGPSGPMAAPCSIRAGREAYLAAGSTTGADNVALAVYDPGATPAVVSVTFATTTGPSSPPVFQGVSVRPGGLVVLDVGHEVASRLAVATLVHSTGGRVVVGAFVQSITGRSLLGSLLGATPKGATRWELPAAPLGGGVRQSFSVLNPTSRPARIEIRLSGSPGAGTVSDVVPPNGVVSLAPLASSPLSTAAATLTSRGTPVVVALALALTGAAAPPPALHRIRQAAVVAAVVGGKRVHRRQVVLATVPVDPPLVRLPSLPAGFSVAAGATSAYRRWLLAGGESDAHVAEVVTVSNPGSESASLHLLDLSGKPVTPAGTALTVPPGSTKVITVGALSTLRGDVPLMISSTQPVVAGEMLYSTGPHPLGLTAATGIPVR